MKKFPETVARTNLLTIRNNRLDLAAAGGIFFPFLLPGCLLTVTTLHSCSWLPHDGLEQIDPAKEVSHNETE
jgi:hypothetical protein